MNLGAQVRKVTEALRPVIAQVGENRLLRSLGLAAVATGRASAQVLHQLWLEVMGAVFLGMAGIGLIAVGRTYSKYSSGHGTAGAVAVAVCFTLTFAWFGLSSFWRVRKRDAGR